LKAFSCWERENFIEGIITSLSKDFGNEGIIRKGKVLPEACLAVPFD
jgi:hypothetical protein